MVHWLAGACQRCLTYIGIRYMLLASMNPLQAFFIKLILAGLCGWVMLELC